MAVSHKGKTTLTPHLCSGTDVGEQRRCTFPYINTPRSAVLLSLAVNIVLLIIKVSDDRAAAGATFVCRR